MAAARLYPTLGSFYKNTYIDFGSEADMLKCVSEEKLYRKPLKDDNSSNKLTGQEQEKKVLNKDIKEKKMKLNNLEAGQEQVQEHPVEDSLEEISRLISLNQPNDSVHDVPCLPSAPPLEWSDDAIQRFLNDALVQQELTQDAPTIDYSALAMPADIPFDEAWIDDLVPDYDTTVDDENDSDNFNNLNKEQTKALRKKSLLIKNIIEIRETPPAQRRGKIQRSEVPARHQHHHRHHKHPRETNQEKTEAEVPVARSPQLSRHGSERLHESRHAQGSRQDLLSQERGSRPGSTENLATKPSSPNTVEYNAWMTWRKQVNRQLATVILLRRNGQVHIQKSDMSRKPLKQSSIDFVSQFAKPDNSNSSGGKAPLSVKTSLGGKPYVMYGIPRVSLPPNQKDV